MRLDLAVAQTFGLSRRSAREAVRAGRIDVDRKVSDEPGGEVSATARLDFHPNRPARHRVRSLLAILVEDSDFLIVDKPAGLLSVPTAERERDTLLARVRHYLQHRFRRRPTAYVAHRLDRDTSGALVFARNRETLHFLQELFREHRIEREYLALVEGLLPDTGTLDADLIRDAGFGRRGVASSGRQGKRAVTRYRVVQRLGEATLVSIELETGRTHQIRVHFAAAGHPVLGDRVYGRRDRPSPPLEVPRQLLHAHRLGFPHPRTGEAVRAVSPVPRDFETAFASLRGREAKVEGPKSRQKGKRPGFPRRPLKVKS